MAERRSHGQGVSIVHKGNLSAKVSEAQEILGFAKRFYDDLEGRINRLANHYPNRSQLEIYFASLYPDVPDAKNQRAKNVRNELFRLFEHGRGQEIPEIKLSTWAAFNAVTEFVDHHRSTRGKSDREKVSRRLQSAWFGSGASLKADAWAGALDLAG